MAWRDRFSQPNLAGADSETVRQLTFLCHEQRQGEHATAAAGATYAVVPFITLFFLSACVSAYMFVCITMACCRSACCQSLFITTCHCFIPANLYQLSLLLWLLCLLPLPFVFNWRCYCQQNEIVCPNKLLDMVSTIFKARMQHKLRNYARKEAAGKKASACSQQNRERKWCCLSLFVPLPSLSWRQHRMLWVGELSQESVAATAVAGSQLTVWCVGGCCRCGMV